MLMLLEPCTGHETQRVVQRVRFAGDLETLWYLRQDVLRALSATDGEMRARDELNQLNRLFKGALPQTMGPRAHQRLSA